MQLRNIIGLTKWVKMILLIESILNLYLKEKDLKQISKQDIAEARSGIKGSPGTVNRYLNYFRAILMYAYEELGWLDSKTHC